MILNPEYITTTTTKNTRGTRHESYEAWDAWNYAGHETPKSKRSMTGKRATRARGKEVTRNVRHYSTYKWGARARKTWDTVSYENT